MRIVYYYENGIDLFFYFYFNDKEYIRHETDSQQEGI